MKKLITLLLVSCFVFVQQSFAENGSMYYVADSEESCGEIFYTCENGWEHFSDEADACGCKKIEKECTQGFNPVCGRIEFSCPEGVLCQYPLPRTYVNSCVMESIGAKMVAFEECEDYRYISEYEKQRVDTILDRFFEKLVSQGYSDKKITMMISVILNRLGEIQESMPNKGDLVYYVGESLQEYIGTFTNTEKEYFGYGTECYTVNYICGDTWKYFSDEKGCGCEK